MTTEVIDKILLAIRLGLHPDRAAQAHGISPSTMRNHRRRNPDFATAIKEAEANAERLFLSRILKHSEKQWTAAAWLAERRFPERWKRHDTVKVDVPGGETVGQAAALLRDLAEIKRRSGSTPPANG